MVYSDRAEEHSEHVRTVLNALLQAGLYLKLQNYKFNAKEIGFVRFVIILKQVHTEADWIAIIKEWLMPECHHNIQVFQEFANFYRRFTKGLSMIVRPITAPLKGGK